MLRLFAAMEAVPWQYRQEMGQWMLQRLQRPDETVQTWWAIGRLAARQAAGCQRPSGDAAEAAQEFVHATLAPRLAQERNRHVCGRANGAHDG